MTPELASNTTSARLHEAAGAAVVLLDALLSSDLGQKQRLMLSEAGACESRQGRARNH